MKLKYADPAKWKLIRKFMKFIPKTKAFPRKFLKGYKAYAGSNWVKMAMPMEEAVVKEIDGNRKFYSFFK